MISFAEFNMCSNLVLGTTLVCAPEHPTVLDMNDLQGLESLPYLDRGGFVDGS